MGEVGDWESVARETLMYTTGCVYTYGLRIPDSKLHEIKQQPYTERDKSCLAGEYWVNTDPNTSWRTLADALYQCGEETALWIHIRTPIPSLQHILYSIPSTAYPLQYTLYNVPSTTYRLQRTLYSIAYPP